ncbi:MAG TPA: hypothetical protein VK489_16390 [Ferruginibacter sp.]|nr:hypothetical protein [Ferruginibacter sp.]
MLFGLKDLCAAIRGDTGKHVPGFGAGKIFIAILAAAKIFFEVYVNFDRLVLLAEKKQRLKNERNVISREERPK